MKYLHTIKEQNVIKDCVGVKKEEKILLKGTSLEKAIQKADRIFIENKPKDFKVIVNEVDSMIAEKYDEKTGYFEQYGISIEVEGLNF